MKTIPQTLSITQACADLNLFRTYFGKDWKSFAKWRVCLKAIYGLPIKTAWGRKVFFECTGRDADLINPDGYQTSLLLCGRRSGKSKIAAVIGAYSVALAGLEDRLSAGETGLISVVSPTRKQGRIVRDYIRALFNQPMLKAEIMRERAQDAFQLRNGNRLEILASDYRSLRGFSQMAVVVDEVCHFGREEASKTRTDTQIINALQPALATTGGKLVAISSPYAKSGWAYETYQKCWANDASRDILVWNAPSKYMNPKLSQKFLDRMKAEDYQNYCCEYLAQFRDDVVNFISLEQVEALVVKGRQENIPRQGNKYVGFCDLSGGRGDASALAIGHRNDAKKIVVDALDWHPSPNDPHSVVAAMANRMHDFGVKKVTGDAYAAEFASRAFQDRGISYEHCKLTKSALYAELLPIICTQGIELLDQPGNRAVKQLARARTSHPQWLKRLNRPSTKGP